MRVAARDRAAKNRILPMASMIVNRSRYSTARPVVTAFVLAAVFWAMPVAPVAAQADLQPLMERLQRLERDIQTLNVQIARGAMAPVSRESAPAGRAAAPPAAPTGPRAVARPG